MMENGDFDEQARLTKIKRSIDPRGAEVDVPIFEIDVQQGQQKRYLVRVP